MKFYFFFLFLLIGVQSYAQNRGEIHGVVVDNKGVPLHNATISVFSDQDSTVIAYTLSSEKGAFHLYKLPLQKTQSLYVTHVNGMAFSKPIDFKDGNILHVDTIKLGAIQLDEVVIERQVPIRLIGDTLAYKASYFKTRPNANVEELLKLLPGLQVNLDGSILFEGRAVSTVRVNNKDFFASDLKIATRNLDASLIDEVQVIRDKGESKREILDNRDLPIVINLKMKREFLKASFGKLYGGLATRDRYESGALINTFRDTLQVSFIGFANNINRSGFDYSELMEHGGLNRSENASITSYAPSALLNQLSAGVNVNYDIEKKLKTNIMYNFDQRNFSHVSTDSMTSFYDEITESSASRSNSENDFFAHKLRAFFRYNIDTSSLISYDVNAEKLRARSNTTGYSNSIRDIGTPVRQSESFRSGSNESFNFNHTLSYEKSFANKWLFSIRHALRTEQRDEANAEESLSRFFLFNDSTIDQTIQTNRKGELLNWDNKANLQVPLGINANLDFYTQYVYNRQSQQEDLRTRINAVAFQNRNDIANSKLFSTKSFFTGIVWNQKITKHLSTTAGLKWLNLQNQYDYYGRRANRTDHHNYLLPDLSISFKSFNVRYERDVVAPEFFNIVAVNSDLYPTSTTFASPYFENNLQDALSMQYFKYFQKAKFNLSFFGRFTRNSNSVANFSTYNLANSTSTNGVYQTVGTDQQYYSINGTKTILSNNVWQLSYSTNLYSSISQQYARVNEEENVSNDIWGRWQNNLSISYKTNVTITPTYEFGMAANRYKYPSDNFRSVSNNTHSFGAAVLINNLYKFRLESSYTLKNQVRDITRERQNLHLINASVYYPVFGKGELKFSVFDLLNQTVYNYFGAFNNANYYSNTVGLRQYFLFGFVYKFLNTSNK